MSNQLYLQIATTLGYYDQCVDMMWEWANQGDTMSDGSSKKNQITHNDKVYKTYPNLSVNEVISMRDNPSQTVYKNNVVLVPIEDFSILESIEDTCSLLQGNPIFTQDRSQAEEQLTQ